MDDITARSILRTANAQAARHHEMVENARIRDIVAEIFTDPCNRDQIVWIHPAYRELVRKLMRGDVSHTAYTALGVTVRSATAADLMDRIAAIYPDPADEDRRQCLIHLL